MAAGMRRLDFPAINLAAEFDMAWRNRSQEHRQHLADAGITFQAMLRTGDLGVERINSSGRLYMPSADGFPAIILAIWSPAPPSIYCAVENPKILDLLALRLDQPETWWRRVAEPGLVLGEDQYLDSIETGAPLKVFDSPLAWLRSGCQGSVFLDDADNEAAAAGPRVSSSSRHRNLSADHPSRWAATCPQGTLVL